MIALCSRSGLLAVWRRDRFNGSSPHDRSVHQFGMLDMADFGGIILPGNSFYVIRVILFTGGDALYPGITWKEFSMYVSCKNTAGVCAK